MIYKIVEDNNEHYILELQRNAPAVVVGGPYRNWSAARKAGRNLKGIRKLRGEE